MYTDFLQPHLVSNSMLEQPRPKLYIVFYEKPDDPLPTILYQSNSLTEADRYLDEYVGEFLKSYRVTGGATSADWLRRFHIGDWGGRLISERDVVVWVECADIVDGCFENIKSGANGTDGISKLIAQHGRDREAPDSS
jgi:hypothetical protein